MWNYPQHTLTWRQKKKKNPDQPHVWYPQISIRQNMVSISQYTFRSGTWPVWIKHSCVGKGGIMGKWVWFQTWIHIVIFRMPTHSVPIQLFALSAVTIHTYTTHTTHTHSVYRRSQDPCCLHSFSLCYSMRSKAEILGYSIFPQVSSQMVCPEVTPVISCPAFTPSSDCRLLD